MVWRLPSLAKRIGYRPIMSCFWLDQLAQRTARVMQVDFNKQVQEWKDILLRGHTPADLEKYTNKFHKQEAATHAGARALLGAVDDAQAQKLVSEFMAEHLKLSAKYEQTRQAYLVGQFDFKTAYKMVRGQDRAPTDLCDMVVARLNAYVQESVAAQQTAGAFARRKALGYAGLSLLLLDGAGALTVKNVLGRRKAVSDRHAKAEIDGLAIDIHGHNEIGEFGESMRGVLAAFEELMSMADAPQAKPETLSPK